MFKETKETGEEYMKDLFMAWFVLLVFMLGGAYFSFEAGFFHYVWDADVSKICFIILTLFLFGYCRLGYLLHSHDPDNLKSITNKQLDTGYEIADMCMALGMLGTVIGFIVMSSSFTTVDFSDVENIKDLFKLATDGMSTALYTTAFGLVSSIILRGTHFIVDRKIG